MDHDGIALLALGAATARLPFGSQQHPAVAIMVARPMLAHSFVRLHWCTSRYPSSAWEKLNRDIRSTHSLTRPET